MINLIMIYYNYKNIQLLYFNQKWNVENVKHVHNILVILYQLVIKLKMDRIYIYVLDVIQIYI